MALSKRNSFCIGFACALLLVAVNYAWRNAGIDGGVYADSPDGAYTFSATAPLSGQFGGVYDIRLYKKPSERPVRHITIAVPLSEESAELREGGSFIKWDAASSFADLHVADQPVCRIWVP